jgi:hypothetical protein
VARLKISKDEMRNLISAKENLSDRAGLRWLSAIFLILLSAPLANAQLATGYTSVRALGMGNAYTAVAEDSDAIFYNPAALAKVDGMHWTIIDPHIGVGNPSNVALLSKLSGSQGIGPAANSLYGNNIWLGGGGKSAVWIPYFGVAAYANTEAGVYAENPAYPRLNMNYYFDYGGAVGMALPIIPSIFSTGITVRSVNRTGTTGVIGLGSVASGSTKELESQLKSRGTGYAVDFGTIMTIPGPISPTVSFTYRDLGYTAFSHEEGAGSPPRVEPEMIAGAAVKFKIPFLSVTPSVDYRYIGRSNVATGMNLNMGLEVSLPLIDLRGGMNQGYYTAGVGLDLGILRVDAATWGVELGAYPGQMVDRRYMAQLTIELGFDPLKFLGSASGGNSGSEGEHHRLKRRR